VSVRTCSRLILALLFTGEDGPQGRGYSGLQSLFNSV
jgi:hypothetical protein